MKRVLVLIPTTNKGKLIMESFASGFEANKCRVLSKQINELSSADVEKFRPDAIFGYNYSFLSDDKCKKIIKNSGCDNFVFYFANEPKSPEAFGDNPSLYKELKGLKSTIFVWDKAFIKEFDNCYYLPLAASSIKYAIDFSGYKYDITFAGNPLKGNRLNILCDLIKVFGRKINIFCAKEDFEKSIEEIKNKEFLDKSDLAIYSSSWKGFLKTEQELAQVYSSSKINLNLTAEGKSSLNYRVFEILASGGFLITDERADLRKYFEVSKQLENFKDLPDLIDKIDFYLQNLNIAHRIAHLGRIQCTNYHNYSARARKILKKKF